MKCLTACTHDLKTAESFIKNMYWKMEYQRLLILIQAYNETIPNYRKVSAVLSVKFFSNMTNIFLVP